MKVLFIAGHEFLYNPQNGGQQCSLRNYRLLQSICGKENVYLCMFSNYEYENLNSNEKIFPTHKNKYELLRDTIFGLNVCNLKTFREVSNYISKLKIDIIFADHSTIGNILSKCKTEAVKVTFFHNIEKNYAWNKVKHEGIHYLIAFFSYFINEKNAINISDKIILLNSRDERQIIKAYGRKADYFLPISFQDNFEREKPIIENKGEIQLLFVGSLFRPNYEGIKWFIENVMREVEGNVILKIVGKDWETKRNELEKRNVKVVGTVDRLDNYYYEADAVIIPIFYGDGMKVKTAEAMMYGKIILATEEALVGYDIEDINEIYECNTKESFLQVLKQLTEKQFVDKYCDAVRKRFLEKYETKQLENNLKQFLESVK